MSTHSTGSVQAKILAVLSFSFLALAACSSNKAEVTPLVDDGATVSSEASSTDAAMSVGADVNVDAGAAVSAASSK